MERPLHFAVRSGDVQVGILVGEIVAGRAGRLVLEGVSDHYVAIDFAAEVRRFRP